mmetsp:Transcript_1005/g.2233  ORF Transcript_1005/g.2233 Transcript_1005/m.2233 type:complete len:357 (-) Transcript_1005:1228-2298(-)
MSVRFFTKSSLALPIASSYALRSLIPVSSRNGAKCSSSTSRTSCLLRSTSSLAFVTPSSAAADCFSNLTNVFFELLTNEICSFNFFFVYSRSLLEYCSLFLRFPMVFLRSSALAVWLPLPRPASASRSSRSASRASFFDRSSSSFWSEKRPALLVSSFVTPPVMVPALLITAPLSVTALIRSSPPLPPPPRWKQISRATSSESHTTVFPTAYSTARRLPSSLTRMTSAASRYRRSFSAMARRRSVLSPEGIWMESRGRKVAVPMRWSRRYLMQSVAVRLVSTTMASMSFPPATVTARLYRCWLGRQRSTSLPFTPGKCLFNAPMAFKMRSSSLPLRRSSFAWRRVLLMASSWASML